MALPPGLNEIRPSFGNFKSRLPIGADETRFPIGCLKSQLSVGQRKLRLPTGCFKYRLTVKKEIMIHKNKRNYFFLLNWFLINSLRQELLYIVMDNKNCLEMQNKGILKIQIESVINHS